MTHASSRQPRRRLSIALLAGGALLGVGLLAPPVARSADATYRKLRVFTQVLRHVQESYVTPVPEEQLVYGAIAGMLGTLDPHTTFMPPDEFRKLKEDTAGEFGGLGLEIEEKDGAIVVVAPVEGGPAARAGMAAGDKILGVDGQALSGQRLADAWRLLRGMAGTKVVLKVGRSSWAEPKEVALIRERVKLRAVEGKLLEAGMGHVRIKSFQERTGRDLHTLLGQLAAEAGSGGLRGLVLDLRNNPGGLLDEAALVADEFLWEGDIVTTQGRVPTQQTHLKAHVKDTQPNYPIIVLVNEGTASASEIVAGALQDQGRALVMGVPTFGKGSVQTLIELEDGSGLKLTVARYFTPRGRSIQEYGIAPDVRVEDGVLPDGDAEHTPPGVLRERDLKHHLPNPTPAAAGAAASPRAPITDLPLRSALDYLKAWQVFGHPTPPVTGTAGR